MRDQHICAGYSIQSGKIVVNETEANIIKYIFKECVANGNSNKVTTLLNHKNIKPLGESKKWYHGRVLKILRNKSYMGDEVYPAIIEKEEFQKVQEITKPITNANNNDDHPLYGLVRCGNCNTIYCLFNTRSVTSKYLWTCSKRRAKGKGVCNCDGILNEELTSIVLKALNHLIKYPSDLEYQPIIDNFVTESECRLLDRKLEVRIEEGAEIQELLDIVQRKLQTEYDGKAVLDHNFLYQKLYDAFKQRKCMKALDRNFLEEVVMEIVIDAKDREVKIFLKNKQCIAVKYHPEKFASS